MNKNLNKLCKIGNAPSRFIIGLMSGTSLDGLDIALCKINGSGLSTSLELLHFTTVPYTSFFQEQVKEVFALQHTSLEKVCLLNEWIGRFHGQLVLDSLKQWGVKPEEVDLIASHGQTIYHAPAWMHKDERLPRSYYRNNHHCRFSAKTFGGRRGRSTVGSLW
jgi:anhydro-N-acetylmuramic acid kinase